jgi:hypothetical protein
VKQVCLTLCAGADHSPYWLRKPHRAVRPFLGGIARVRALGRPVAAGIWLESDFQGAACGPLRDPVMCELHLDGAATPRSPARDLARPRSA